jgi:DNA-binding winged helix-turn-helix (wHTH) protein
VPSPSEARKKAGVARFGIFEADLDVRELRKQGRRLRLQDQPFAVLAILLERAGEIVSREELRQKLWSADTFVDFDHSLNTAINKIREVLGDSASSPRFVETLARRGYRFIAEVRWELHQDDRAVDISPAPQSHGAAINATEFPGRAARDHTFAFCSASNDVLDLLFRSSVSLAGSATGLLG